MAGRYTYLACDLISGRVRERVDLVDVTAERTLDQSSPGQFSAKMPLGGFSPVIQQSRIDATESARSTIVVVRDGVALGEWIIWQRPDRPNDGSPIPLSGSYITSYFDSVIPTFSSATGDLPAAGWSTTEQLDIAALVAGQCQDPITSSTAPTGSHGLTFTIAPYTASGQARQRQDSWVGKQQTALAMLCDLSDDIGGFDWTIDVQLVGNHVVRTLRFGYPRLGIDSGLVLQPAEGKPGGNVTHVTIGEDGHLVNTQVVGVGSGQGDDQVITYSNNTDLVAAYPLLQSKVTSTSVVVPATMQAQSDAQALVARSAQVPPDVTVLADAKPQLGSYNCGDYLSLSMGKTTNYPRGYKTKVRLLGYTIKPPAAGPETVQLSVGNVEES